MILILLFSLSNKFKTKLNTFFAYKLEAEIDNLLGSIPNIALNDVPIGKDESLNKEYYTLSYPNDDKKNCYLVWDDKNKKLRKYLIFNARQGLPYQGTL